MANAVRLALLGVSVPLAKEIARQINSGSGNVPRLMALGIPGLAAKEFVRQIGSGQGSANALAITGINPILAREVSAQITDSGPVVPAATLTLTPVASLPDDAPVGTVVATISGVSPADAILALDGPDAALLAISGADVVTAAELAGPGELVFWVSASRAGYTPVTRAAAVDVIETPAEPEDPDLILATTPDAVLIPIYDPDGGIMSITIGPEEHPHAGSYEIGPEIVAALAAGPVCLVVPTVGGDPAVGSVLTAVPGLWIHDADAGVLTVSGQWHDVEVPIPGATGLTYTRQAGDHPVYVETATDANGSRTASADAGATVAIGAAPDTFTAPDGTRLAAYVGESGIGWGAANNAVIEDGALRNASSSGVRLQARLADLAADQFAEADIVTGASGSSQHTGVAVRIGVDGSNGYCARMGTRAVVMRLDNNVTTFINTNAGPGIPGTDRAAGTPVHMRLEAEGDTIRLYLDGVLVWSGTDATHATGRAGIMANGVSERTGSYLLNFHAGEL